jgi:hypothetical protein
MTTPIPEPPLDAPEIYVRMYYEHQYDRMDVLENQRLTITLVVIAASTIAFALSPIGGSASIVSGAAVPILVATFNLFAIAYIARMSGLIDVHADRAKRILERAAKPVYDLDASLPFPAANRFGGRNNIHLSVHLAITAIALLLLLAHGLLR